MTDIQILGLVCIITSVIITVWWLIDTILNCKKQVTCADCVAAKNDDEGGQDANS